MSGLGSGAHAHRSGVDFSKEEVPGLSAAERNRMRRYRLDRLQRLLVESGADAAIVFDSQNIRYATDHRYMAVWTMANATRHAIIPPEGLPVLMEHGSDKHPHLAEHHELVGDVRATVKATSFYGTDNRIELIKKWADETEAVLNELGIIGRRIAVDKLDGLMYGELHRRGWEILDGQSLLSRARLVKCPEEIVCLKRSVWVCQMGMQRMEAALQPGMTENALWSILHQTNIELDGEWISTRLLTSGPKTNPWSQECGMRVIQEGELVAYDTDLVGPNGYCADISRTVLCGEKGPTPAQREIFSLAHEQLTHNTNLFKPGVSFIEICDRSWRIPEPYQPQRDALAHGIGLDDEFPVFKHYLDRSLQVSPDEVLVPGMTFSVESYMGALQGGEGVKLEDQILITETGVEVISSFPFDSRLLH